MRGSSLWADFGLLFGVPFDLSLSLSLWLSHSRLFGLARVVINTCFIVCSCLFVHTFRIFIWRHRHSSWPSSGSRSVVYTQGCTPLCRDLQIYKIRMHVCVWVHPSFFDWWSFWDTSGPLPQIMRNHHPTLRAQVMAQLGTLTSKHSQLGSGEDPSGVGVGDSAIVLLLNSSTPVLGTHLGSNIQAEEFSNRRAAPFKRMLLKPTLDFRSNITTEGTNRSENAFDSLQDSCL